MAAASAGWLHAQIANGSRPAGQLLLNRDQASAVMPPSVFYRGQSASIQARNSAGIKMSDGRYVLMALVDTSGYSSAVQQTYQAYLLTEIPLTIGSHLTLKPGAYGFGFVGGGSSNESMVVMDIGGNEILRTGTTHEDAMARPTPLQILPGVTDGQYKLCLGRSCVVFLPIGK